MVYTSNIYNSIYLNCVSHKLCKLPAHYAENKIFCKQNIPNKRNHHCNQMNFTGPAFIIYLGKISFPKQLKAIRAFIIYLPNVIQLIPSRGFHQYNGYLINFRFLTDRAATQHRTRELLHGKQASKSLNYRLPYVARLCQFLNWYRLRIKIVMTSNCFVDVIYLILRYSTICLWLCAASCDSSRTKKRLACLLASCQWLVDKYQKYSENSNQIGLHLGRSRESNVQGVSNRVAYQKFMATTNIRSQKIWMYLQVLKYEPSF